MEELTESLDRLNTNAKEWKPGRGLSSSSDTSTVRTRTLSSTRSGASWQGVHVENVKEFVPATSNTTTGWQHQPWEVNASVPVRSNGEQQHASEQSANTSSPSLQESGFQQQQQEEVDISVAWWARGATTVPTPQYISSHQRPQHQAFRTLHTLGMPEVLWKYYRDRARETLREIEPNDQRIKAVPPMFGNVYCLDRNGCEEGRGKISSGTLAGSFGYPSSVFKVVSREDGLIYCLRRLDNAKCVSHRIASTVAERWCNVRHPAMCTLHKCFVQQRATFFVHEFCPGARTLEERYISGEGKAVHNVILPERLIWSYVTQLVGLLRFLHARGMACRSLQPNHILVTDGAGRRLRVSSVGVIDALEYEARKSVSDLQMEDIVSLGRLIFSLTTRTLITPVTDGETLRNCDVFIAQNFSPDLHGLALTLLGNRRPLPTIFDVCGMISNHAWDELDVAHADGDAYNEQLAVEYESGRALRLLLKLGFINERPEFGMDHQWAETGDCYVLKLFRDYVFHQADAAGHPVMDLGHVVSSLNKLDAADPEKIALVSRDGKALLVVSFADVARCLEHAYEELCQGEAKATFHANNVGEPLGHDFQPMLRPREHYQVRSHQLGMPYRPPQFVAGGIPYG